MFNIFGSVIAVNNLLFLWIVFNVLNEVEFFECFLLLMMSLTGSLLLLDAPFCPISDCDLEAVSVMKENL